MVICGLHHSYSTPYSDLPHRLSVGICLWQKEQVLCEINDIFMTKMYFFTYLFLLHTLSHTLSMQYFSSKLFVEVLEKWGTRMDIGGSRQTDTVEAQVDFTY